MLSGPLKAGGPSQTANDEETNLSCRCIELAARNAKALKNFFSEQFSSAVHIAPHNLSGAHHKNPGSRRTENPRGDRDMDAWGHVASLLLKIEMKILSRPSGHKCPKGTVCISFGTESDLGNFLSRWFI